ncbi:hypothetical protein Taro_035202 [Colocasia esculenta]|uniref:Uncharacterized protein n=1 Tax=Colocasia esculenta TaxID=4460 RepID=A0A843VTP1_COLES|nr:hypothetical protein [Colocasia esculenta]
MVRRVLNRKRCLNPCWPDRAEHALFGQGEELCGFSWAFWRGGLAFGVFSLRGLCVEQGKRREIVRLCVLHGDRG